MRFMILIKATKDSEAGVMPSERLLTEMGAFNEELVKAGVMLAGEGLHPSSKGARVKFAGEKRIVTDGPFAETKELLAGYWLWQCKSKDEAIEWVKRCPNPMPDTEAEIEIRQVFDAADFGAELTPELREQEERLRTETARYNLDGPRFENGKELLIAGLNDRYTMVTRANIPDQWERFAPRIGKVPGQIGAISYGVCWNTKPGCDFDYLAGVEVKDLSGLPADFKHLRIPAGRYAVFTHRQHVSALPNTIEASWMKWLPNSGYEAAQSPCFERYTEEFNPHTGMGGMEIWIPIKG